MDISAVIAVVLIVGFVGFIIYKIRTSAKRPTGPTPGGGPGRPDGNGFPTQEK